VLTPSSGRCIGGGGPTRCPYTLTAPLSVVGCQAPLLVTALARQVVATAQQPAAAVALCRCLMLLLPSAPGGSGSGGDGR
jgi:hypothetical protein